MPRRHLPVVMTTDEVAQVLAYLCGVRPLLGRLLDGTGLRITQALQLRVKEPDSEQQAIFVREGKRQKTAW